MRGVLCVAAGPAESASWAVFPAAVLGYFEGLSSERGIAWRVADSLSLRAFLDLDVTEAPPNHSTLSRSARAAAGSDRHGDGHGDYHLRRRFGRAVVDRHGNPDVALLVRRAPAHGVTVRRFLEPRGRRAPRVGQPSAPPRRPALRWRGCVLRPVLELAGERHELGSSSATGTAARLDRQGCRRTPVAVLSRGPRGDFGHRLRGPCYAARRGTSRPCRRPHMTFRRSESSAICAMTTTPTATITNDNR